MLSLAGCRSGEPGAAPTATGNTVLTLVTPTVGTANANNPPTTAGQRRYVVQEGDTLSSIAARFGVSEAAIQRANGLADPDAIFAGQELMIPAPEP